MFEESKLDPAKLFFLMRKIKEITTESWLIRQAKSIKFKGWKHTKQKTIVPNLTLSLSQTMTKIGHCIYSKIRHTKHKFKEISSKLNESLLMSWVIVLSYQEGL